ncbi:MAG: methyl-accepting chemotaxis protein [Campylobacterota bacterium]|nr:methyl-accepting chemotaxis protein [Campylobacterota bacterium]
MKWTISRKFLAIMVFIFSIVFAVGLYTYQKVEIIEITKQEQQELKNIEEMLVLHYKNMSKLQYFIYQNISSIEGIEADYRKCIFTKWYEEKKDSIDDRLKLSFEALQKPHQRLHQAWGGIINLVKKGEFEKAETLYSEMEKNEFNELLKAYEPLLINVNEIRGELNKMDIEVIENIQTTYIIVSVFFIVLILGIIYYINSTISHPISTISDISKAIAKGDLTQEIDFRSTDEIGELADSFRQMNIYIQNISDSINKIGTGDLSIEVIKSSSEDILANSVDNMVNNLKNMISDLVEGINVLTASVSQILATTSELSSSASETSSAVMETSTTSEEVRQTSQLNYEKAKHVVESTKQAKLDSTMGRKSFKENMDALQKIQESMDNIAQKIIELSEQSQAVGEIITAVEDIANQTNILSVNAAIEAVKAGEQGKGFSVVAQELKSLAEQSKEGTTKVQKILTDIQKATSSLVMIAEKGSNSVNDGMLQAKKVEDSFVILTKSIEEAANSSYQISLSSEQGQSGMVQISDAMNNIKESNAQNLESIQQVESAVNSLSELSHKLKTISGQYIDTNTIKS